jgi:hypothetical protein
MHNAMSGGWDPSLNTKFIHATYMTCGLKVTIYKVLNAFFFFARLHETFYGVEFSTCGIMLAPKNFQRLEHFRFYIFISGMLNLYLLSAFPGL